MFKNALKRAIERILKNLYREPSEQKCTYLTYPNNDATKPLKIQEHWGADKKNILKST